MTLAELLRSSGVAAGEIATTLGSGMAAQPVAGLAGLLRGTGAVLKGKDFGPAARKAIESTQEAMTYQPRTDIGQRGVENVAKGIETVTDPIYENVIDPVGMKSPALGAGLAAGLELIGPRGKPKAMSKALRTDPLSPQGLIPGVEPLTPQQALTRSLVQQEQATNAASFTDRGVRYQYQPDNDLYEVNSLRHAEKHNSGDGPSQFSPYRSDPEMTRTQGDQGGIDRTQAGGAVENFTRMAEGQQAVADANRDVGNHRVNVGNIERNTQQAVIDELRGRRAALGDADINERVDLERAIFRAKRDQPIVAGDRNVYRQTENSTTPSPRYQSVAGQGSSSRVFDETDSPVMLRHADRGREQQQILVNALREQEAFGEFMNPEPSMPEPQPRWVQDMTRLPSNDSANFAGPSWWNEQLGLKRPKLEPDAMNRDAVAAFLEQARGEEGMFKFGLMPKEARTLEDFADAFSKRTGDRLDVERGASDRALDDYYDSDASQQYIKEPKEHGRGEVMRDRWGDYKQFEKTHESGDVPMYDESGNVKKIIDDEGNPTDNKKFALGGEPRRDSYGDQKYGFKKSRGGEPVYDERGNQKERKVENPDYESPPDENGGAEIRIGEGYITLNDYDSGYPTVDAMSASRGGGGTGELLYQTLLSDAVRNGYEVGSSSLTGDNAYRLLSNTLSNYARTGKNPRDVTNTAAGASTRLRGRAEGPELWRAEAEEAKRRVKNQDGDPNRLMFDGENFTIDGEAVDKGGIKDKLQELSPDIRSTKVGEKSLMRMAIFDWLRRASPEEAKAAATGWNKGNIFTGIGAGAVGLSSLLREDNQPDDAATQ